MTFAVILRNCLPTQNIYELDYLAHAVQVAKECIQPDIVTRTFEDGYVTTMPFEKSIRSVYGLIAEHGAVEDTVVHAVDEDLLKSRLHDLHEKQNKFNLGYYVPPLRPLSFAAQTAYNGIKEAHPEAIVCFAQNGYFEIYGEDAKRAAPLIHSKLLMKELEGGGQVAVTGFKENEWILRSNMLWAKGNDVLLSRTGEDGKQETVKELRGTDYFPVGLEWCYEGNIYKITDVNYQQDTVTLINQTTPSQVYEEYFITDYDCSIHGVTEVLGEYESLDALNYFAARLDEMPKHEQDHFVAIMESGCDEVSGLTDLINLTYNLDCYDFIPGIKDHDDLGRYYFSEGGYNDDNRFGSFVDYIDFERYGEDCAINEGGTLTNDGYIRPTGDSWSNYFDGSRDDIPDEYKITGSGEEPDRDDTLIVLVVEPQKEPYLKEIPSGLESLQQEVGGYIQAVYPYEEPVALICNEEGKLEGLPLNRALRDEDGDIYDIVAGTFLVVGLTDDNFGSLTVDQIRQFSEQFKIPEVFAKLGDKIVTIPMINEEQVQQEAFKRKDFEVNIDTSGLAVAGHIGTWHAIRRGHERMQELDSEQSCSDKRLDEVCSEYRTATALTYELAHAFISAMYIHDQDNIEIVWKFNDIFENTEGKK